MFKHTLLLISLLTLVVLLAACGSSNSSSSNSTGSAVIKTATVTVNGTSQTILTNMQGMTLYYFKPDSATTVACTGQCVTTWPPLLLQGNGTPTSTTSLSGTLSAVNDGNGMQIEYNGHPLYIFSGDTAAGQTNGEGIGGQWFVATPDLQSQGTQPTPPTPSGNKYGGY
jgi:predicted lipoprotein with Yx(FWY)xxD motif